MIGSVLHHYEILRRLGEGGMGEVYVARDTKLGRDVALKVLPPELAADPDRRARFAREARAVAALNHPSIVTVYSIEEADGVHFMTMELVEGRTLTESIPRGGLPLARFFAIAVPLVDAVAAAHAKGITHRDLKPDNVMVPAAGGSDGAVKVLDFGLAKLGAGAATGALQTVSPATSEGRILGTVAYMSPEQAQGLSVDPRSDIFSLGTVLYEMVTGETPFKGDTGVSVISAIVKDTPASATEINPGLPRHLGRILKLCLAKDPARRFQSTLDLRNELENLRDEMNSGELDAPASVAAPRGRHPAVYVAVGVVVAAGAFAILQALRGDPNPPATPAEGSTTAGAPATPAAPRRLTRLTRSAGPEFFPSLSPDAKTVYFASPMAGNWDVYMQRVAGDRPVNLTQDSPADDSAPALSPDGEQLVFESSREGGGLFLMGATGESVRRLTDSGHNPCWSADGRSVVYSSEFVDSAYSRSGNSSLWRIAVAPGARPERIYARDAVQPSSSPNGRWVAFWALPPGGGQRDLYTIASGGGPSVPLTQDRAVDWSPSWSHDGKWLFFSSNRGGAMNLWRLPIDEATGKPRGAAEPVTSAGLGTRGHVRVSADGKHLVYVEWIEFRSIECVAFDPEKREVVGERRSVVSGTSALTHPCLSHDGKWLVYSTSGGEEDLFVCRPDGSESRRLTVDPANDRGAEWSPDGEHVAFFSNRSGKYEIWVIRRDGSGLRRLTDLPESRVFDPLWSPDGTRIALGSDDCSLVIDASKGWEEQVVRTTPPLPTPGEIFEVEGWSLDGKCLLGTVEGTPDVAKRMLALDLETDTFRELSVTGDLPVPVAALGGLVYEHRGTLRLLDDASGMHKEILALEPGSKLAEFSVAKDGRRIFFAVERIEADVWMLELK